MITRSAHSRIPAIALLAASLVAAAATGSRAQLRTPDPLGDYGDAPDDALHRFPTKYATTHSRAGYPGAVHLITGLEMLGDTVSAEHGAEDGADPDGIPNLVNTDADDGLFGVLATSFGSPFLGGGPLTRLMVGVRITIPFGAPPGPRYLNILLDMNRDQEWATSIAGAEWVAENLPIDIPPGVTRVVQVPLGVFNVSTTDPASDMWMRMTLTRDPIGAGPFAAASGWDGSGVFAYGETEDHIIYHGNTMVAPPFITALGCDCRFTLECPDDPLIMLHGDQTQSINFIVNVTGPNAAACPVSLDDVFEDGVGPVMGLGAYNGTDAGDVIGPPAPGIGPLAPAGPLPGGGFQYIVNVPVKSGHVHDVGLIQSFRVRARFKAFCGGGTAFAGSISCGVLIVHPDQNGDVFFALLPFGGAFSYAPGLPIALPDSMGGPPLGYVTFGNNQPTSGLIRAMQIRGANPVCFPDSGTLRNVLPVTTFLDVHFNTNPNTPNNVPLVQTSIVGLGLTGYTDQMVQRAGITNESSLRAAKMPTFSGGRRPSITMLTEQVAQGPTTVDTVNNIVMVNQPRGFSAWVLGSPGFTQADCNGNGTADVVEIGLNGNLDCYNRTAGQVNGHYVMGGPDLVPDTCECLGDWDRSGAINPVDVAQFIASWFFAANNPGNLDADVDCNGIVAPADVAVFINAWFGGLTNPAANGC